MQSELKEHRLESGTSGGSLGDLWSPFSHLSFPCLALKIGLKHEAYVQPIQPSSRVALKITGDERPQ